MNALFWKNGHKKWHHFPLWLYEKSCKTEKTTSGSWDQCGLLGNFIFRLSNFLVSRRLNFQKQVPTKLASFSGLQRMLVLTKEILVTTWCENTSITCSKHFSQSVSVCSSATVSPAAVVDPHHSRAARESRVCKPASHNSVFWLDLIL